MYYFPNGNVYSSGLYKNDVKIGEWQYNNEEAVKETTIIYNEKRKSFYGNEWWYR